MSNVRTRIPPSPTGMFHIGSLRTALYNYLYAKKHGGKFILRIEDTDRERFVEGATENIVETLEWAGLTPDEGPYIAEDGTVQEKGEVGPYVQSNRLDIYTKHMDEFLEKGHAYHCFCTKERLDELRKVQQLNKQATGYDGHCRNLSKEEVDEKLAANTPHVTRLRVPEGSTTFNDAVLGEITVQNHTIDDQVLMKTDGFPTYHFAVVVDDHLMGITHISRGVEWLPSTPKHVMMYDMFGWEKPIYAHQQLLVNEQKKKLSKRHGDVSVKDFVAKGYLKEALLNFVAFLGWNPGDEREMFTLEELVEVFDFAQMSKSPAFFNREKLDWYNKQYLMNLPVEVIAERALPYFKEAGMDVSIEELSRILGLERGRVTTLAELPAALKFVFELPAYDAALVVWKKSTAEDAKTKLHEVADLLEYRAGEWTLEAIESDLRGWIAEKEYGAGDVLWPTRTALSGQKHSPSPFEIASVLGKEETLRRLRFAADNL